MPENEPKLLWIECEHLCHEERNGQEKVSSLGTDEAYETMYTDVKRLFRSLQREFGRCVDTLFTDGLDDEVKKIGWVFAKRCPYHDDPKRSYVHEVLVTVMTEKPVVVTTTTRTFYDFKRRQAS